MEDSLRLKIEETSQQMKEMTPKLDMLRRSL